MQLTPLNAISPADGRYREKTEALAGFFSEEALIRYRVRVEVAYFIALCRIPLPQLRSIDTSVFEKLEALYTHFSTEDARAVKAIEKTINHDVKAVEYFIKDKFNALGIADHKEFIHFGLTSQDINNTAIPLSLQEALEQVYRPVLSELINALKSVADSWANVSMLARTHGQPASPTRMGKEMEVFIVRIEEQLTLLDQTPIAAKFGGATGNFNAHQVAYPEIDWKAFGKHFVETQLGLHYSFPTTQIEHYDHLAGIFDALKRINTILIDFSKDVWMYIAMDYFKQKIADNEVGSSAMPHKVNPIDFENAEGNLGIANALFQHLSAKLPVSRLQRDLTDSTVLRNIGVPIAHTLIGMRAIQKGLTKLLINTDKINSDLEHNWAVVAEAIQTILRREGVAEPYEKLKALTRNHNKITRESIQDFIAGLPVTDAVKTELKGISPHNYTGI